MSLVLAACTGVPQPKMDADYMSNYEKANRAGDDAKALEYLQQAADHKNPEGLVRLGEAYLHGRYGLHDPKKALALFQQGADKGSARGMTELGILYLDGDGVSRNYNRALSLFMQATEARDMKASRYVGIIWENGLGRKADYEKAAHFYKLAADRGDITGQYRLGQLYEKGRGVAQDYLMAHALYLKSADRGDKISLPAIMALGNMFEQGLGVGKNMEKAMEWYAKGAELGDKAAKAKIAAWQYPNHPYVMNVTAIAKILGDGQKVAAVAVEYKDPIDAATLRTDDYKVPGRLVSAVYTNDKAAISSKGKPGNFVIVELKTAMGKKSGGMGGGPKETGQGGQPGFGGPKLGEVSDKPATPEMLKVKIIQSGEVDTTEGAKISSSAKAMESNRMLLPEIKDFRQRTFHDAQYKKRLMYNLYVPANYDPAKKYPLVLFMHDAGAVSNNHIKTLTQGLGAVVWTSKEDQARHPCFVLAPQYNAVMVDDSSHASDDMDVTIDLIKSLMSEYSIDADRIYNTGQSMGGMTSIAMDIKYPDFFAASFLVACQWNPDLVAPLAQKPLWIVVSEGDTKAHPGMDAITAVLQKNGATIAKAQWDAQADRKTLQGDVEAMLGQNASVNYTVFKGGDHRYTWQYAYSIPGIRDWLFQQHKGQHN